MSTTSSNKAAAPTLTDLEARLDAARHDGTLTLSGETLQSQEVGDLVDAIGLTELALAEPSPVSRADDSLSVEGKAKLYGLDAKFHVTFGVGGGVLAVTLIAEFLDDDAGVEIGGLSWAKVGDLELTLAVTGPTLEVPVVTGALSGTIVLEGLKDPIRVTLGPTIGPDWVLSATGIPLPNPAALTALLPAGQNGAGLTPPSFAIEDVTADLSCRFDPGVWKVSSLIVGIECDTWEPAPRFSLKDARLSLGLEFDDAGAVQDVTAGAAATVRFDLATPAAKDKPKPDPLELPVVARRAGGQWTVGIEGAHGFPSLHDLVAATDPATADLLPTALGTLQMGSATLELTLGETAPTLRSIFFSTALAQKWELVEGHLWLDGVALQVMADCVEGTNTSGFVNATIEIDDFALPVAVTWPPNKAPWTLKLGSSASHELKGVGSLAGVTHGNNVASELPEELTQGPVTLSDLTVTFDPVARTVQSAHIEVDSKGPWVLDKASGADVRDLSLALGVDHPADPATRQFTGKIAGTLDVNGFTLRLAASKDPPAPATWNLSATLTVCEIDVLINLTERKTGGWDCKGSTGKDQQIPLGKLVDELAHQLGSFDVPASLAGTTLSNLEVDFDTGGTTFKFGGHAKVPMGDGGRPLELGLVLTVSRAADGSTTTGAFQLTIDDLVFDLRVTEGATQTRLVAAYTHQALDAGKKELPPPPSISIAKLVHAVDPSAVDFPDLEIDLKEVVLAAASGGGGPARVLFALELGEIDLSQLPVVGSLLPGAKVDDLKVIALTATPVASDVDAWNAGLPEGGKLPAMGLDKGIAVSAVLRVADLSTPLALPASTSKPSTPAQTGTAAPAQPDTKWFDVQRSFGPFTLARVGGRYDTGRLWVLLDASMTLAGLSVSLQGLGVGTPLDKFDPSFHLDGLGIAFREDPIEIAGAFLVVPPSEKIQFQYDGAAVVRAESFALSAVGSYAKLTDGASSLFIFVELDAPLGGPPALFVTGLMGGFGYNRALRIPNQDEVYKFPFVQGIDGGGSGTGGAAGALAKLEQEPNPWLSVEEGENWLAVGVTFTSFEVVESKALLIAEFGKELQLALIGLSKLRLPQEGDEEFAYLELEIEAILKPNEGFFGLTAQVSPNSFVIDRACRLTGGFAFYLWFDGDHEGDFVLTLGGYHPAFSPPVHYPKEPRLGLSWPINDLVSIDGSAYFALTPSCVMAGGGMHVLFHDGNVRAWLTASADFLISWEPFQYGAHIGVSVGVSYHIDWGELQKTLSVELGAELTLWGPPTGGTAYVSWYVISFTIGFGADPPAPPEKKPDWSTLEPLLPDELCKVTLQAGLLPGTQTGLGSPPAADVQAHLADAKAKPDDPWLVRADTLKLATESAVPATTLRLGAAEFAPTAKPTPPAIRPLGLKTFGSTHTLRVTDPQGHELDLKAEGWSIEPRTRSMPSSLWGKPLGKDDSPLEDDSLISDQLVGFTISPPGPKEGPKLPKAIDLTYPQRPPDGTLPSADRPARPIAKVAPKNALAAIAAIATDGKDRRAAIRALLHEKGLDPGTDDALADFAANAAFAVPPMLLGSS